MRIQTQVGDNREGPGGRGEGMDVPGREGKVRGREGGKDEAEAGLIKL